MNRMKRIEEVLNRVFQPSDLRVENESHMHSVPPNSETHFKVFMVAESFVGQNRVQRQRAVNDVLKTEFDSGLHALTQRILTPEEYAEQKDSLVFNSPNCAGKRG